MSALSLLLGPVIACLPAWLWLHRLLPATLPARPALVGGYAILLGAIATTLVMRVLSALGIDWSLLSLGLASAALAAPALLAPAAWRAPSPAIAPPAPAAGWLPRLFIALCLGLLASRLLVLGLEVTTRPLYAWDAKQHWVRQARVFFELGATVPYVDYDSWLARFGEGVYTNIHPDYPITVPLLQAFTALSLGVWRDDLITVAWPLIWAAMGLIVYGQARLAGASTAVALAATYVLLSLPYLNTQVALGGYADLVLAACFLAATAAFYNWSRYRYPWLLGLCLLATAACVLIKNEGLFWALSIAPGLLVVAVGPRRGLAVLALLALALPLLLWLLPDKLALAGHSLADLQLAYRPQSWQPILVSFFIHDNWHFTAYLFLAALLAIPFRPRPLLPLAVVLVSALALYLLLYLFTANASGAVRFTSLNRVALHLVPALGFFAVAAYLAISRSRPASTAD